MAFIKGDARINRNGRPLVVDAEKPTNKSLRNKAFLQLLRKFAPHLTGAVNTAVGIMGNKDASEAGKLKASALIIGTYRDLLKEAYNQQYDEDDATPIMEDNNKPVFSLRMLKTEKPLED